MTWERALVWLLATSSWLLCSCVERTFPGSRSADRDAAGDAQVIDAARDAGRRRDAGTKTLLLQSLPADGARNVPPSIASIAFRMSRQAPPSIEAYVESRRGRALARVIEARCEASGLEGDGWCGEVALAGTLERDETCRLELRAGELVETISFRTADDEDVRAPSIAAPFPCMPDEIPWVRACIRIEDVAVIVRFVPDEVARVVAATSSGHETASFYEGGVATLRVGDLAPGSSETLYWWATDLAGNQVRDGPFAFRTRDARPRVAVTEVSSNPTGPEPAQEWIEVLSWAAFDIDVGGFSIVDDSGESVVLPEGSTLRPGEHALVVAMGFDPSDARDVLPAPGTRWIRIGARSLGTGGIRNGGESLELRDRDGRVVSRAPAVSVPAGDCLVRAGAPEVDDPAAWEIGACTPGAPP